MEDPTTRENELTLEATRGASDTERSEISEDATIESPDSPSQAETDELTDSVKPVVSESVSDERESGGDEVPAVVVDHAVDEQVLAFEESLAMTCPTCESGDVRVATTEKGKKYYVCDDDNCNFISWGKPYHFTCLYCKNPFLVEFHTSKGDMGLKCPKATCNYRQDFIGSPLLNNQHGGSNTGLSTPELTDNAEQSKKKKKKVVRKKFVRRKR
jgi:hypothetical protein